MNRVTCKSASAFKSAILPAGQPQYYVVSGTRYALQAEPRLRCTVSEDPRKPRAGPPAPREAVPSRFPAFHRLPRTPASPAPCTSPVRRWFSQTPPSPTPTDTLGAEGPRTPEVQLQPRAPPSSSWLRPLDPRGVTWLERLPPRRLGDRMGPAPTAQKSILRSPGAGANRGPCRGVGELGGLERADRKKSSPSHGLGSQENRTR